MAQVQSGFKFYGSGSDQQAEETAARDRAVCEAEARVRAQEAHVLRLIVQGAPTQMAEDLLRKLTATAQAVRDQRRNWRG